MEPIRRRAVMAFTSASGQRAIEGLRPIADLVAGRQDTAMRNILVVDGADNATFSVFPATDDEFRAIFPNGQDMELAEALFERIGDAEAASILTPIWERPILKRDAMGIHGTLFYDNDRRRRHLPNSKREVDWDESAINEAQRRLLRASR